MKVAGKASRVRREDVVLATKFFDPHDDPNRRGGSPSRPSRAAPQSWLQV
jgi:aryl-alcohol dehydrogenase-like predicted oxidoreductase